MKGGTWQAIKVRTVGGTQISWPSDLPTITGLVTRSTTAPPNLRVHNGEEGVTLGEDGDTVIILENIGREDAYLLSGQPVAVLEPKVLEDVKGPDGGVYIYQDLNGKPCRKVHAIDPEEHATGEWKRTLETEVWKLDVPGVSILPVMVQYDEPKSDENPKINRINTEKGRVTRPFSTEERSVYLRKYTMKNRMWSPTSQPKDCGRWK